jgi:hypothetical protein
MDKRLGIDIEDLFEGTELTEEELRSVAGAQARQHQAVASTCLPQWGQDSD